jgi:glycosyltransferase involved in cell wall biosynthesis
VVTTDVGAHAEIVEARTTGELVAPDRPDLLSRALCDVLGDPFLLEAYGDAGWERYRSAFDVRRRAGLVGQLGARLGSAA